MTVKITDDKDKRKLAELALGRIFGMMQRPFRDGDIEEYERCRAIVMAAADPGPADYTSNYARDRNKGAAGD